MPAAPDPHGPGDAKNDAGADDFRANDFRAGPPQPTPDKERVPRIQIRGLILLALLLAFFAFMRASRHGLFAHGWWRIF